MIAVIGDIHGNPYPLKRIVTALGLVDEDMNWKMAGVSLVFTGDVCDRGTDSAIIYSSIMKWQQQAPAFGSSVDFIIGNHEVMNICGYYFYNTEAETRSYAESADSDGSAEKLKAFSRGGWVYDWLLKQHFIVKKEPFIVAHADFPAEYAEMTVDEVEKTSWELFEKSLKYGDQGENRIIWSREVRKADLNYELALGDFLKANEAETWVCGHTPSVDGQIKSRLDGRYICVDTAMGLNEANASALIFENDKIKAAYLNWDGSLLIDSVY